VKLQVKYGSIFLLCLSAIILIALQLHLIGWFILSLGLLLLLFCEKQFAKDLLLLYISTTLLGLTSISTDISYNHIIFMGITLGIAVLLPYITSRFIYKDHLVRFTFHHGRSWYKKEIFYIFFTAIVAYLLLPFALRSTGSYHNWTVTPGTKNLIILFIGTQSLGLWDELFFISTVLGILRRYFPFSLANIFQAIMMTSFLYELGFRKWFFIIIFLFSLIQGYVFKKTESLFYVITIHLTLDLVLYLVLLHLHHSTWLQIFLT
jgi:membrane protease YdiL (CAAX protease family)